jgi:hypothetical protein
MKNGFFYPAVPPPALVPPASSARGRRKQRTMIEALLLLLTLSPAAAAAQSACSPSGPGQVPAYASSTIPAGVNPAGTALGATPRPEPFTSPCHTIDERSASHRNMDPRLARDRGRRQS